MMGGAHPAWGEDTIEWPHAGPPVHVSGDTEFCYEAC
jgi:hypothetical protein